VDEDITLNKSELFHLTDEQLIDYLKKCWKIPTDKFLVVGEMFVILNKKTGANSYWIDKVRNLNGELLDYPLEGVKHLRDSNHRIYIPPKLYKKFEGFEPGETVRVSLELSDKKQREFQDNPLLVQVKNDAIESFIFFDEQVLMAEGKEGIDALSESLFNSLVEDLTESAQEESANQKSKLISEIKQIELDVEKQHSLFRDLSEQRQNEEGLVSSLSHEKSKLNETLEALLNQITKKQLLLERIENKMDSKLKRLKNFIEVKASLLKDLGFIDQEEFDELLGAHEGKYDALSNALSFQDDLDGSYAKAVSHIHAYMLEQDILYPRHVIENFLALIKTNDLIILAGDSGSGKTNLVKSFAEAIGGVAKIIPVKPNWTSSEDLLGFYNPLESKYTATPFLEALIEAQKHPDTPYFICLDEMNLARVEYYFADFLSKLEERIEGTHPLIQLYTNDESAHVLSELNHVLEVVSSVKERYSNRELVSFLDLLKDTEANQELKKLFGLGEQESLIKYHVDIRRMISGVLNIPSEIPFPPNVRIIGAINIDETTHYLSPKILDRAHIMKFKSPLLSSWDEIMAEVENYELEDVTRPVRFNIEELGVRRPYPKFQTDDEFCMLFTGLNLNFFHPLGIEFGMRPIRQGLNYLSIMREIGTIDNERDQDQYAINNFILHKVFPKIILDGSKMVDGETKINMLARMQAELVNTTKQAQPNRQFSTQMEMERLLALAENNDQVVNYWMN
jgi:energy-coupling factor transporter ATP-binding protein EcfA2